MRRRWAALLLAALAAQAAVADVDRSGEAARAARAEWTRERSDAFRGKRAVDVEMADLRFTEMCSGASSFRAAFELAQDGRLVFASLTLQKGKFVRGKIERFGLPDVNLTAKDWEKIRSSQPVALTLSGTDKAPVCLVPAKSNPRTFKAPRYRGFGGMYSPAAYLLGRLPGLVGQLGARYEPCGYEVLLALPKNAQPVKLTTVAPGKSVSAAEAAEALRKALNRTGSEREMLEICYSATVTYRVLRKEEK